MEWQMLLNVALSLSKIVLAQATKSKLPAEIIESLQVAVAKLEEVHGTPVTKDQVESLRLI